MLLKQGHKEYGDSKAMCLARREFFKLDYYASLKNKLSDLVKELNIKKHDYNKNVYSEAK